jgi:TPR repeat protein
MPKMSVWASLVIVICALTPSLCRANTAMGLEDFRHGRFAEAFREWQDAAAVGEVRGTLYLGVLYDTGLGIPRDTAKAMSWYSRAAELGSAAAAFNVGVMYDAGVGVPPDRQLAAKWYASSAAKGFGRAEYNLAMLYEAGTANRARAIRLYKKAAAHGIAAARAHLAALGVHVAIPLRDQGDAATRDFQRAQQLLLNRGPSEAAQAAELFRQAAEQGNPVAEYDLGYCYERGLGVTVDRVQAYDWYHRAALNAKDPLIQAMAATGARNLAQQLTASDRHQGEGTP